MPRVSLPVCESDLTNLRASGLTDSTIWTNRLRTEAGALVFPYRDLDGNVNCFARRRPHAPSVIGGKLAKYIQPPGSPLRAYFPAASLDRLRDGVSTVYVTEGEKKALALSQFGLAAVGIGGVWCGCKPKSEELIDDLAAVPWDGRDVYILFDYDPKLATRQDVDAARKRLARALRAAGAAGTYAVELPTRPDGGKQGVDDFIVANGADAFGELLGQAVPVRITPTTEGDVGPGSGIRAIKIIPPALGEAAYHGPIGRFLRAVADYTEATDAAVLAHTLPALGTVIGPGPHIFAGTRQAARVNTVLVGPTSTGRKGTSLAPVDELMSRVDGPFWLEQRIGGLSTGEGLIGKVADKRTQNPMTGEWEVEEVEKRVFVIEEEFSKVLAQLRREGNILSQVLRESYDSGNLSVMTRNNPLQAGGAHISIVGHITPEELRDRFNHIEMANGFGNRFLWFAVKSDKVFPFCRPIPAVVYEHLTPHVRRIVSHPDRHVPLAPASAGAWEKKIYPSLREDKPGFAGALLARGSSMVLRLALIYCLLDLPPKGGSREIQPAHLDAAMAVWGYCEASVQMLFKNSAGTFLGDKILELLGNSPLTKDAMNDHLSPRQKADAPKVLAVMEAAGLIRKSSVKRDGAGRPATLWERVP